MPDGKTHAVLTTTVAMASMFTGHPYIAAGATVGLVITPDLDVDSYRSSDGVMKSLYGKRAMRIWRAFWYLYSKAIPHRNPISHFPIVSTAIRIAYVAMWAIAYYAVVYSAYAILTHQQIVQMISHVKSFISIAVASSEVHKMFIGLCIADTVHALADFSFSEVKRWTKKSSYSTQKRKSSRSSRKTKRRSQTKSGKTKRRKKGY